MGAEWKFKTKPAFAALKYFLFFWGSLDLFIWTLALSLYGIYLFKIDSLYYAMFALHLLHSITWPSMMVLTGTGHGRTFDRFATGLIVFVVLADAGALITRVFSGASGAGSVFDVTSYVFTVGLMVVSTVELFTVFLSQEWSAIHRMMTTDYVNVQMGSQTKGDSTRSIHRWAKYKKRAVLTLASLEAALFVAAAVSFFIQIAFLGEGFILLLIANIPHSFMWVFALSVTGSSGSFPPDGAIDVSEIFGTTFAYALIVTSGFVLLMVSALLPSEVPGPPFVELWSSRNWTVSFYITVASIIIGALITALLGWLHQDSTVTYKEVLEPRARVFSTLTSGWEKAAF